VNKPQYWNEPRTSLTCMKKQDSCHLLASSPDYLHSLMWRSVTHGRSICSLAVELEVVLKSTCGPQVIPPDQSWTVILDLATHSPCIVTLGVCLSPQTIGETVSLAPKCSPSRRTREVRVETGTLRTRESSRYTCEERSALQICFASLHPAQQAVYYQGKLLSVC
jgi:hypothetical protein